ncbi:MAG: CRTAC1 family protein [Armatimonadetes bacterium]|nr:CRTAC1 family protein [Armatimonadota bacterium]
MVSIWRSSLCLAILIATVGLAGCRRSAARPLDPPAGSTLPFRFTEVAAASGIHFVHHTGAFGEYRMPETMGSGCALFDYDGDGHLDALLVNGQDWSGHGRARPTLALYRNRGDGTFEDVTAAAGLAVSLYGMGCAVGDYDNDGYPDLFVTAYGNCRLFHNRGNGTFTDVTDAAGVASPGWSMSAAWLDYDRDGHLDLFVCHYVVWDPSPGKQFPEFIGSERTYNTPQPFPGETNRLYRNLGNGHFQDVTEACGVYHPSGKALGVATCDVDLDGWPDLAVAHDTQPNQLLHNVADPQSPGGRRFEDTATSAGIAYSPEGVPRGAMGIDAAPIGPDNREALVIGNFSNEQLSLYRNDGQGIYFTDLAPRSEVGRVSQIFLAFGVFFFDGNNDGAQDIFVATGHVKPQVQLIEERVTYRERPLLFLNQGNASFTEVGLATGLREEMVARGAACGDVDNDGDLDILVSLNGGPARLYRNDGGSQSRALAVRLIGRKSNRSGYGAKVYATVHGRRMMRHIRSGTSYCSHSDATAHFGLGAADAVELLEIEWPGGERQRFENVPAGRTVVVTEGASQYEERPFAGR